MNNFFYRFFKVILSKPKVNVLIIAGITLFFAFQLPKTELDNNNIQFIPEKDEARATSKYIDNTFGSSLFVLVGLERKYGTVFDMEFLNLIRDYAKRIEEMNITGKINSIVSSDYVTSEGDTIIVRKLVDDDFSGTPGEINELKRKILSWDIYRNSLISNDFRATQILVPLEISAEDAGKPEVIDSFILIRDIAKEMFQGVAEVYVTGLPVISATINEAVRADLMLLIPLVVLLVLVILFFSFKNVTAVILPLITVLAAVIWCIGAMPLFGIKLSVISTVLPVILIAVGSAYGIHVITHYMEDFDLDSKINAEEHKEIMIRLMLKIGKAVSLAALTTFSGFFSFCLTSVVPIREFGFFASFGVFSSFIVAVIFIPSMLLIRGPRPMKQARKAAKDASAMDAGGDDSWNIAGVFAPLMQRKKTILFFAVVIVLVSVYGASNITIDNAFVEYFKATTDISRSDTFIREKFGGSKIVSVVAMAESPEILLAPASLKAMDDLNTYLEERVVEVGKTLGFTDLIKRINQVYYANESPVISAETIPYSLRRESPIEPPARKDINSNDFGFGDFGFDDEDTFDRPAPAPVTSDRRRLFGGDFLALATKEEIIMLMEKALSQGKNRSMNADELIREMRILINYEGAAYYEIPSIPERYGKTTQEELQRIISNYLVLVSGSISSYADNVLEPTAIKTTIQLRTTGEKDTAVALDEINKFINANFPENIKTIVGGSALIESSLNRLVVQSQLISVITSLLLVFLILAFSYKSLTAGFIGIAPLSISILINFAVMYFMGIKLNLGTSMVASVAVGIGIDYTIHFMEAYRREYRAAKGGDFLTRAYATSGKAIIINAVSVGAGFAVLVLSQFVMLQNLGLLIALTMGTSALTSLMIIPALLLLIKPKFMEKETAHG